MSESILPPDIREKLSRQTSGGVGSSAKENRPRSVVREEEASSSEPEGSEETEKVRNKCPNTVCGAPVEVSWSYCPRCRTDLLRDGAAERLGLKFNEEDLSDYLFKGYISREIKLLGRHNATIKSGQPKDLNAIDNYIMNGSWSKDENGDDRKVSDFFIRQMNAICQTASCVIKIDGEAIGDSFEKRVEWLMERGSAFVDILCEKVSLYNQALGDFLKKEDSILGS